MDKKAEVLFGKLWKELGPFDIRVLEFTKTIRFYAEACATLQVSAAGCVLLCRCGLESLLFTVLARIEAWNHFKPDLNHFGPPITDYSTKKRKLSVLIKECGELG